MFVLIISKHENYPGEFPRLFLGLEVKTMVGEGQIETSESALTLRQGVIRKQHFFPGAMAGISISLKSSDDALLVISYLSFILLTENTG